MAQDSRLSRTRPFAWALSAAIALVVLFAPSAQAGPLVASAPSCDAQDLSRPFVAWADPASYTLNGGGSFEGDAAGWTLNGASVESGNEPYYVHGSGDSHSLSLGGSGSATSSTICVGLEHPDLRFFARNSGSPFSGLRVEVQFEDASGGVNTLPIGTVGSTGSWQPTLPIPVVANLLPLLPGEYTPVAFRFTPTGAGGNWRIDDVYVDPWHH